MILINQNKLMCKIIIKFIDYTTRITINNIKLNTYILIKNQYLKIILHNTKILIQIKIYSNIIIYIIEIMNYKYHNNTAKYIKSSIYKIICNNILIIVKINFVDILT